MKKLLLIFVAILAFGLSARAQFTIGGDFSFKHNARENTALFRFCPDVGYTIGSFYVGAALTYERIKSEGEWERNIGITPYVDYYFWASAPLSAFLEGGCGIMSASTAGDTTLLNWTPYLSIGLQFDITEHWCVEFYPASLQFSALDRELDFSVLGNGISAGLYYTF